MPVNFRTIQTISYETIQLDRTGKPVWSITGQAQQAIEDLGGGISLELIAVRKGSFQMGSRNEGGYEDELPLHPVFLHAFWMGQYPVTQAQWQRVMGSLPDCRFHGARLPVENICWRDAVTFCERLSNQTGHRYYLPTEAQWEYACRAGTATPFSLGETITTDYANFVGDHTYRAAPQGIYRHGTTPVGSFLPNPWGLYDMHGNVWEFCADPWSENYTGAPVNGVPHSSTQSSTPYPHPESPLKKLFTNLGIVNKKPPFKRGKENFRVARGGSWHETPGHCRSAMRLRVAEDDHLEYYGLRVALADSFANNFPSDNG